MIKKAENGLRHRIRFVTLFPECPNYGLIKDVGQIPYRLAKNFGVNAVLVSSKIELRGEYISEVPELKIKRLSRFLGSHKLAGFVFILLNAKKIDWLNLYHFNRCSLCWGKLYKLLNKEGKIYRKLDLDYRGCRDIRDNKQKRRIFQRCVEQADLASAESESVILQLKKYTKKLEYIPDGYFNTTKTEVRRNNNKQNIFLTVGRLGSRQKATEVLLRAFVKTAGNHDWKLVLAGNVKESFKEYIERFYHAHPSMRERILFVGQVSSREKLYEMYDIAKVMVLPSRWESFGIVLAEALSRGCRIIATEEVPPIKEITNNGKYGYVVAADDIDGLAKAMVRITKDDYSEEAITEIKQYAKEIFSWDVICGKLYKLMQEKTEK